MVKNSTLRTRKHREIKRIRERMILMLNTTINNNRQREVNEENLIVTDDDICSSSSDNSYNEDEVERQLNIEINAEPLLDDENNNIDAIDQDDRVESDGESLDDQPGQVLELEHRENDDISDIRRWAVNCRNPHASLNQLLTILKRRSMPEIPKCAKAFLKTHTAEYEIVPMQDHDGSDGEFTYLGIKQGLLSCVNPLAHTSNILPLVFNIIDGIKFMDLPVITEQELQNSNFGVELDVNNNEYSSDEAMTSHSARNVNKSTKNNSLSRSLERADLVNTNYNDICTPKNMTRVIHNKKISMSQNSIKNQSKRGNLKEESLNNLYSIVAKLVRAVEENTKRIESVHETIKSFMSSQDERITSTMTKEKLSEKYNLHFPINNLVNFKEMNDLITKDDSFKKDMCQVLLQYTEKKNHIISLSLVTMLKAFLTRELTMNFVAQRESNGKFAMNHTPFYICLKEVIIDERSSVQMTTSENEILCALGSVLTNAKNWPSLIKKKKLPTVNQP